MKNYHTHTFRCGHATGDIVDYVEAARAAGLDALGVSDHLPYPDGLWADTRMPYDEFDEYLAAIAAARNSEAARIGGGIAVSAGAEGEWIAVKEDYLRDLTAGGRLDYLIGGVHWIPFAGDWLPTTHITRPRELTAFADYAVSTIESGLFDFIAHPDIFCARWRKWDADSIACSRAVLEAAASTGTPLEINGYGMRKPYVNSEDGYRPQYPFDRFWELAAEYPVAVVVNSDAHRPVDVAAGLAEGRELAARFGLRVVEDPVPVVAGA